MMSVAESMFWKWGIGKSGLTIILPEKKIKIASLASNERDNSKDKTANSCSRILNSKSSDMERVRVGRENNGTVYSLMALIE